MDEIPERFSTHEGMLLMDDSLVSLVNFTRNESVSEDDCHANCESSFCGDKKYSQVCETERSVPDELMDEKSGCGCDPMPARCGLSRCIGCLKVSSLPAHDMRCGRR